MLSNGPQTASGGLKAEDCASSIIASRRLRNHKIGKTKVKKLSHFGFLLPDVTAVITACVVREGIVKNPD